MPWHKIDALSVFVYPKLHYLMRVGSLRTHDLSSLDSKLKSVIKSICGLPSSAPNCYIEGPASCCCLGFPSVYMWQHAHTVAQFVQSINDEDTPAGGLARAGFLHVVTRQTIREAVNFMQTSALRMGPINSFIGRSHWTHVLSALKALNSRMEFQIDAPNDKVFVKVGLKGKETHTSIRSTLQEHMSCHPSSYVCGGLSLS